MHAQVRRLASKPIGLKATSFAASALLLIAQVLRHQRETVQTVTGWPFARMHISRPLNKNQNSAGPSLSVNTLQAAHCTQLHLGERSSQRSSPVHLANGENG